MQHRRLVLIALFAAAAAQAQPKSPPVPEPHPAAAAAEALPPAPALARLKQRADIGEDFWKPGAGPGAAQLAARQNALPREFRRHSLLTPSPQSKKPAITDLDDRAELVPLGEGYVWLRVISGVKQPQSAGSSEVSIQAAWVTWLGLIPILEDERSAFRPSPKEGVTNTTVALLAGKNIVSSTLDPAKLAPGYAYSLEIERRETFRNTDKYPGEKDPRGREAKGVVRIKWDCKAGERIQGDTLRPKFKGGVLPIDCTGKFENNKKTFSSHFTYLEEYGYALPEGLRSRSFATPKGQTELVVDAE